MDAHGVENTALTAVPTNEGIGLLKIIQGH